MIRSVLVLGAGSAGLIAAITLKQKIPTLAVRIIRSPEVGVIGVGESTTPNLPVHLFDVCKIDRRQFHALANPTWKMGIHFLWGPRPCFEFGFVPNLDVQWSNLRRQHGFYCDQDFSYVDLNTALMAEGKAFERQPGGVGPKIPPAHAFHLENPKFVAALEVVARQIGIEFIDAKLRGAERGPGGITSVVLEPDGRRLEADFYVDASGFRSELLGRTLAEPFISFSPSLFCDRAIVGNWQRTDEPILPYTTAETMEAGWCWRIEHEHAVNRGYVYSSAAISDEAARDEFLRKNPKAKTWDRVVKFVSGRYRRAWVDNVVGIGNACGFVEPLEATALMVTCWHAELLADVLLSSDLSPTPTMCNLFNEGWSGTWDEIREFLTLHYHRNGRIQNDFWTHCHHDADISRVQSIIEFYEQNGPTGFLRYKLGQHGGNLFGVDGFLIILVGLKYPYKPQYTPTEAEWRIWNCYRERFRAQAKMGMDVKEALAYVKHPNWQWHAETSGRKAAGSH